MDALAGRVTALVVSDPLYARADTIPMASVAVGLGSGAVHIFDADNLAKLDVANPARVPPPAASKKRKVLSGHADAMAAIAHAHPYTSPPSTPLALAFAPCSGALVALDAADALHFFAHPAVLAPAVPATSALTSAFLAAIANRVEFWDLVFLARAYALNNTAGAGVFVRGVITDLAAALDRLPDPVRRVHEPATLAAIVSLLQLLENSEVAIINARSSILLLYMLDVIERVSGPMAPFHEALASDYALLASTRQSWARMPASSAGSTTGADLVPVLEDERLGDINMYWHFSQYDALSLMHIVNWTLQFGLFLISNLRRYATVAEAEPSQIPLVEVVTSEQASKALARFRELLLLVALLLRDPSIIDCDVVKQLWQYRASPQYADNMYHVVSQLYVLSQAERDDSSRRAALLHILRDDVIALFSPSPSSTDIDKVFQRLDLHPHRIDILATAPAVGSASPAGPSKRSVHASEHVSSVIPPPSTPPALPRLATQSDVLTRHILQGSSSRRQCMRCHGVTEARHLWSSAWIHGCPCGGRWKTVYRG